MPSVADKSGNTPGNPGNPDLGFASNKNMRTAANAAAVEALTPAFVGERAMALDTGLVFMAQGSAASTWIQLATLAR